MIPPTEIQTYNNNFARLQHLRERIYHMPAQNWSVELIAKDLSLSRSRFQHLYTQFFVVTVKQDIIANRLEHARKLLSTTQLAIHEIAEISGYRNAPYFMQQFKEQFGITPTEYHNWDYPIPGVAVSWDTSASLK